MLDIVNEKPKTYYKNILLLNQVFLLVLSLGSNPFSLVDYDNALIDNILSTFKIDRFLSRKGNPYDNAVSEATNKILKIEFIYQRKFETLDQLQLELAEHIYWYNNQRIHGSLDYMTPIEYRELNTVKLEKAS